MEEAERKLLAEFIRESDAIEGITDDPELLERQIADGKFDGHVGAMLLLETWARSETVRFIDEESIRRIQGLITAEQHLKPGGPKLPREWIGRYRNISVSVGGRICPGYDLVPALMDTLLGEIHKWQKNVKSNGPKRGDICTVADLHFVFERIHPFADGNGRTGRALVWYLLRYAGIQPFIFTDHDKHETYHLCFEEPVAMRRYFMKKMGLGIQTVPVQ